MRIATGIRAALRTAGASVLVAALLLVGCSAEQDRVVQRPATPTADVTPPTVAPAQPTQPSAPAATPQPGPTAPAPAATAREPVPSVELASSPAELAQVLSAAELAIRDESTTGSALAQAAHTQQRAYRMLALRPRWQARVLDEVPREVRRAVRRNIHASQSLTALVEPQRKLPDWRIVKPAPAVDLLAYYRRAAAEYDLQWQYLAAIHLVETRMGRIRGRSTAGARGPMQFMPATWEAYGRGDISDNADAIMAAARYLAAHGAPGDMHRALWHYNHSDRYVAAVSAYAANMRDDERTFRGYYHWQVHYMTTQGDVHLPEGYGR